MDAKSRTVGFQRQGTGWVVPGLSNTPVMLAEVADASFGHTS
jgi:hypothetical protein